MNATATTTRTDVTLGDIVRDVALSGEEFREVLSETESGIEFNVGRRKKIEGYEVRAFSQATRGKADDGKVYGSEGVHYVVADLAQDGRIIFDSYGLVPENISTLDPTGFTREFSERYRLHMSTLPWGLVDGPWVGIVTRAYYESQGRQ